MAKELKKPNSSRKDESSKSLIQDDFYGDGSKTYKMNQFLVAIGSWLVLLFPLLIMLNSIARRPIFKYIYHWSNKQGRIFSEYITIVAFLGIFVIGVVSFFLVKHNNRLEIEVLSKQKFYDEKRNLARLELMDEIYTERFGDKQFRENSRQYIVTPEQEFSRTYLKDRYKEREGGAKANK